MRLKIQLIMVWLTLSLTASAQGPKPPFTLAISPVDAEVKAGSEVYIRIVITNTSDHKINCSSAYASGADRSYRYMIEDDHGRIVNKNIKKHPELDTATSLEFCSLQPGESSTSQSRLGIDYDFKHPGKYLVQIARPTSDRDVTPPVLSNKITITVIEDTK